MTDAQIVDLIPFTHYIGLSFESLIFEMKRNIFVNLFEDSESENEVMDNMVSADATSDDFYAEKQRREMEELHKRIEIENISDQSYRNKHKELRNSYWNASQ